MGRVKIKSGYLFNEVVLMAKEWEKFKKVGDKELYKKYNKYSDYEELRIYFNDNNIEIDAHIMREKQNEK
jgi:hypothetical protein